MAPVDIGKLSTEEFKQFINSFDHVLSDCDGVLWHYTGACAGAGEMFEGFKQLGKQVKYVSNNSGRNLDQYRERFSWCGISDGAENIIRPTEAIGDYLKSVNFKKKVFCVSNKVAIEGLENFGFQCKVGPETGGDDFRKYLQYFVDDPEVGAVVFDGDFTVNLPKLYMAATYLRRPDVLFISGPTDKEMPLQKGFKIMGLGQFCNMVADFTGREPIVLAKPGRPFADFLLRHINIADPSRVLFIGDMMEQDIGLGKVAGFQTLLILGTHTEHEMNEERSYIADFYTTSLIDVVRQIQLLQEEKYEKKYKNDSNEKK